VKHSLGKWVHECIHPLLPQLLICARYLGQPFIDWKSRPRLRPRARQRQRKRLRWRARERGRGRLLENSVAIKPFWGASNRKSSGSAGGYSITKRYCPTVSILGLL